MKQQTRAIIAGETASFERYFKPTRRNEFQATMDAMVLWTASCVVIDPHYSKGIGGRPPISLERMLRIHLIQHCFNLASAACEEVLYDSAALRRFASIDRGHKPVLEAITMQERHRLLNDSMRGEELFAKVGQVLQQTGFKLKTGPIVDVTITRAPSSTKHADKRRDPSGGPANLNSVVSGAAAPAAALRFAADPLMSRQDRVQRHRATSTS